MSSFSPSMLSNPVQPLIQSNNETALSNKAQTIISKSFIFALIGILITLFPYQPKLMSLFASITILALTMTYLYPTSLQKREYYRQLLERVKLFVFFAGSLFLGFHFITTLNQLETTTGFVYLCMIAKCFELKTARDRYLALFFAWFVLAMVFLFDQGLATVLKVAITTIFLLSSLAYQTLTFKPSRVPNWVDMYAYEQQASIVYATRQNNTAFSKKVLKQTLQQILLLTAISLPLMGLFYVFVPRIDPLWQLQIKTSQAKTGITDSLTMGDISKLNQSFETAFTVNFLDKNNIPSVKQRYFRGVVLGHYDGATWSQLDQTRQFPNISLAHQSAHTWVNQFTGTLTENEQQLLQRIPYELHIKPTQQPWLYSLGISVSEQPDISITRDYTLIANQPIESDYKIKLNQTLFYTMDGALNSQHKQDILKPYLDIPTQLNLKSVDFAKKLFAESNQQPDVFLSKISNYILTQNYSYTLSPPALNSVHKIDDFWFNTKAGYCEYYASSIAFMLRATGVPARVVAGYQGGTVQNTAKPEEVLVRQMDAHAWVEYWQPQKGWQMYDPTAQISPDRIESGMESLANSPSLFGEGFQANLSYQRYQTLLKLNDLGRRLDNYWRNNIVDFDKDKQDNFLNNKLSLQQLWKRAVLFLAGIAVIISSYLLILWYRHRIIYSLEDKLLIRLFNTVNQVQSKQNLPTVKIGDIAHLTQLLSTQLNGDSLKDYQHFIQTYQRLKYMPHHDATSRTLSKKQLKEMKLLLNNTIQLLKQQTANPHL